MVAGSLLVWHLFRLASAIQLSPILLQGYVADVPQDARTPHIQVLTIVFLQTDHYRTRVRHRDPCCLISGLMVVRGDYSRFKAAHIYPRAHDNEVCPSRLFYSHLANIGYPVDPQGLSKSYHRSCTSCRTRRINQDWLDSECDSSSRGFARCVG